MNLDRKTVDGFGAEWARFAHEEDTAELRALFQQYFSEFPWTDASKAWQGADIGCGSGRWARLVAPLVGKLHCVDASEEALVICGKNLSALANIQLQHASVGHLPFKDGALDFAYSLGVLHHVPDTRAALAEVARVLKPGAPFLVYLYYSFDNRPWWYRKLWKASDVGRRWISRLPDPAKFIVAEAIAASVYFPLSRAARLIGRFNAALAHHIPLSVYRDRSYYVLRTDALDRLGTQLEKRFSRDEIERMLRAAGFEDVQFRADVPYWCAVARRASS